MNEERNRYMDGLAIKAANSLHGEHPWDVAHACAVVSVHAICQSTVEGAARERRLDALFDFMRGVLALSERADKDSLQ